MSKINVKGLDISIISNNGRDEICLTDMVKNLENDSVIISNGTRKKTHLNIFHYGEQ